MEKKIFRRATKRTDGPIQFVLPKAWVDNVGLDQGGTVQVKYDDKKLTIFPFPVPVDKKDRANGSDSDQG